MGGGESFPRLPLLCMNGWQYKAYRDGKNVVPEISLRDASPAGLEAFRTTSRKIAAILPSSDYDALSADPAIFIVDVTPGFVEQHIQHKYAAQLEADDLVIVSPYPIYWYLESKRSSQP